MSRNSRLALPVNGFRSASQGDVVQVGDSGSGDSQGEGCAAVVAQDLVGLEPGQGTLDPSADLAVTSVVVQFLGG